MSVLFKEKEPKYNQSQFYRANPYAGQGYIPSASLKNRKQPQFQTQIPQGIEYFEPSTRKHFENSTKKSEIVENNLFNTPETFPMEHKIATDINYDRSLNTIDISGASVNSKKPLAIRNRIKAQQQLLRRNAKIITPLLATEPTQEQRRRKLAQEHQIRLSSRQSQIKNLQRKHHSEKKLPPSDRYIRNPYVPMKDEGVQMDMTALQKQLQMQQQGQKQKEQMLKSNPEIVTHNGKMIESRSERRRQENIYQLLENKSNFSSDIHAENDALSNGSRMYQPGTGSSSRLNAQIQHYFDKEKSNIEKDYMKSQMRQQYRQLNPTNLSYAGNIHKNSSVFSTLGKLALQ